MSGLDQQLSAHFQRRAEHLQSTDPGVQLIMEHGSQRRARKRRLLVGGGVAAVGVLVAGIAVVATRDSGHSIAHRQVTSKASDAMANLTDIAAVRSVDPMFDWTTVDGDAATTPGWGNGQNQTADDAYLLSTIPGRGQNFGKQAVYHTTDGKAWTLASPAPLKDLWLSDVVGGRDTAVYGIGTAPGAKRTDVELVGAVSADGGVTFDTHTLPIDLNTITRELGGQAVGASQVASNGTTTVAVVSGYVGVDVPGLVPDGTDASNGAELTADGIAVYGPPEDLVAIAKRVCPGGWELKEGPPSFFVQTSDTGPNGAGFAVPANTTPGAFGPAGPKEWHCSDPQQRADDLFIDATQVHGDVIDTFSFTDLGLGNDSIKALLQQPRVFTTTDGVAWTEVELPANAAGYLTTLVGGPAGYLVTLQYNDFAKGTGTQRLLFSRDGSSWTELTLPTGLAAQQVGIDAAGQILAVGTVGTTLVVARSIDGEQWTVKSLSALLGGDPSIRGYIDRLIAGPAGVVVLVQASVDALAAKGGIDITHGDLVLHIEDTSNNFVLRDGDGVDLDVFSGYSGQSVSGMLRQQPNGVNVVRPDTGEVITSFTYQEMQNAIGSKVTEEDSMRQQVMLRFVLSSVNGEDWSAERFDQLGLIGQNMYASGAFSDDGSVSVTFTSNFGDPAAAPIPPVVLTGTPIR